MDNPFHYFDAIFLMNLDDRPDRLAESLNEFKRFDIKLDNLYRFPGVFFNIDHPLRGRAGCATTHRDIISVSKSKGFNKVLVVEDDFYFVRNPIETIQKSVDFLSKNEWHLFYLGQTTTSEVVEKPIEVVQDGILRLRGGLATHAIAYNSSIYDYILKEIPEPEGMIPWIMENESIDRWYMTAIQLNNNFRCYTVDPILCIQRPNYSDVDEKNVDYSENLIKAFENERKKCQTS